MEPAGSYTVGASVALNGKRTPVRRKSTIVDRITGISVGRRGQTQRVVGDLAFQVEPVVLGRHPAE